MRSRRGTTTGAAVLLLAVGAAVGGCTTGDPSAPSQGPAAATSAAAPPTAGAPGERDPGRRAVRRAVRRLAALPVIDRQPSGLPPYQREEFGSDWADVDGNGCNQRDDVLLRDAVPGSTTVAVQGGCDHDVLAGTFVDPYRGATLVLDDLKDPAQAQAVQVDHVVPLAEAWISGAAFWTPERRRAYANDLDALLAVDGPTNASKGADDPAAWRPRAGFQCAYAVRWIALKHRWTLGADASEIAALGELLATCD